MPGPITPDIQAILNKPVDQRTPEEQGALRKWALASGDSEGDRRKAESKMQQYLDLTVINKVTQRYTAASLAGLSTEALALNKIIANLKAQEPQIVAAYGEHFDNASNISVSALEPEQFTLMNWKTIFDAIQPGTVIANAARSDINAFSNEMDTLLAANAHAAQQRADRKAQLKQQITDLKDQFATLSMNKQLFGDPDARNVLDIAQTRLGQAETALVNQYSDVADTVAPQDFLNNNLLQYLAPAFMGTGISIPKTNLNDALNAITNGAQNIQQTNQNVKQQQDQAKQDAAVASNIAKIKAQFVNDPALAAKAEADYRNALSANPNANPSESIDRVQIQQNSEQQQAVAKSLVGTELFRQSNADKAAKNQAIPVEQAIAKTSEQTGITSTSLAKAQAGDTSGAVAEQYQVALRASGADHFTRLADKLGIDPNAYKADVARQMGSNQSAPDRSVYLNAIKKFKPDFQLDGLDKVSPDALGQYVDTLPNQKDIAKQQQRKVPVKI